MKVRVLSSPQIVPSPTFDGPDIQFVAQIEKTTTLIVDNANGKPISFLYEKGEIRPVIISYRGTKNIPQTGEVVEVVKCGVDDGLSYER